MDPSSYHAARLAFERIVERDPAVREAALAEIDDTRLREAVRALLLADEADVELRASTPDGDPPEHIGDYKVVGVLGRGGMGLVYDAEQQRPRRRVALKVLHPWLRTEAHSALARREAQCLADLDHPGIPRVIAQFEAEGPVVVMERVEGTGADAYVLARPWRERVELLARICDAVDVVHRAGIVHRDLKPANIVVRADGQPVILDFGIAAHPGGEAPEGSGTPGFMPPDPVGAKATVAVDLWALGTMGSLWLDAPPEGRSFERASESPRRERPPRVRADLAAVLAKGRAEDPVQRYASAGAMAQDLRRVLRDEGVAALPGLRPRLGAWLRRRRRAVFAGAVLVLAAVSLWAHREALDAAYRAQRSAPRLEAIRNDPRGFLDPGVRSAFDALVRDPDVLGTSTLAEAWRWARSHGEPADALAASAAAWIFAPPAHSQREASDLAARLIAEDAVGAASLALPTVGVPGIDRALAVARREFSDPAVPPDVRRIFRALAVGRDAGDEPPPQRDGATILPRGGLRWQDGSSTQMRTVPCEIAAAAAPRGGPVLAGCREGASGLFRVDGTAVGAFEGGGAPEPLPISDVLVHDLDGDGAVEVIAAVAGWRGHELRVFTGPPWRTASRLRVSAWSLAADGGRIFVLGGPLPSQPAPRSQDPHVLEVEWAGGELALRRELRLPSSWSTLRRGDLDGDGHDETALFHGGRSGGTFGLVLDGRDEVLQVPGFDVIELRDIDGDGDDELRARLDGGRHWFGVRGGEALSLERTVGNGARDTTDTAPAAAVAPDALPAPLRVAWERALSLLRADPDGRAGLRDVVAGALVDLARAAITRDPGSAAVVARGVLLPFGEGTAGERAVAALGALAVHFDDDGRRAALDVLSRSHAWDDPLVDLQPRDGLTFVDPLPPWVEVGDVGSVRRLPLDGSLELDLVPDLPPALRLPVVVEGPAVCVEVDLHIVEMSWSAALRVRLSDTRAGVLWRVGGGPREGHLLNFGVEDEPAAVQRPFALGPRTVDFCVARGPASASVRMDGGPRRITRLAQGVEAGRTWLSFEAPAREGYDPQRRALLRISSVRLRGARFDRDPPVATPRPELRPGASDTWPHAGPVDPDLRRAAAEGEPSALRRLVAEGAPIERAIALELLGAAHAEALRGLDDHGCARLLRRAPRHWIGPLQQHRPRDFARLWMAAWWLPLHYEDPWLHDALLDPALAGHGEEGLEGVRLEVARARALLVDGQFTRAEAALESSLTRSPEAALVLARLRRRQGRLAESQAAVRSWLDQQEHPQSARDRIEDDAELGSLFPWVRTPRFEPKRPRTQPSMAAPR